MELAKELITAVQSNNSHGGYGLQKECEALVGHVLSNMVKSRMPSLVADVKNEDDSTKFREEGNQSFVSSDDDEAIEKYTMSLAYATRRETMSLAFANRSAALYRKQHYRECLIDIDAALSHGYPDDKQKKLKERARKAVEILRQLARPKDENMNDLPIERDTMILKEPINELPMIKEFIDKSLKKCHAYDTIEYDLDELMARTTKKSPRYVIEGKELGLAHGPSDEAPALSRGVRIAYSKKYGRYLEATEKFKPGDVIAMEKPYAYVIYREKYYTHCHHCLERSYNLLPCPNCPIAQYCSKKCMNDDWIMAHCTECPVLAVLSKLLNLDKDKIRILTKIIRLLIIATKNGTAIDEVRSDSLIAEKNTDNRTAGFTKDGKFEGHVTRCALSLATNLDARPLIEVSAFACISALAAIILAVETKFFGKKYEMDELKAAAEMDDVRYCGTLVFRNCVIVSSNSYSVQQELSVKSGSGLYVTCSLMNHSCAPNTFRHFSGITMISRAIEPINPGDQIFTCYGGGYQYMDKRDRRAKMFEDYFFRCDCQACAENWPTYVEILKNHVGTIAKTNKELVAKLRPYRQRLLENKYDIEAVKSVLDMLYAEVKMPCEEIVHAVEYLKSYYLGKFHESTYTCNV